MIGTCGAAGETKSSERGRICFVCFGVLRLPSQLRAALGSKANISLNTLRVQETPGLPAAFEATWPAAGVKRGSCEQQFDRCSRCLSPFPDAAPRRNSPRALRSPCSGRAIFASPRSSRSLCESTPRLHRESTVNLPLEIHCGRLAPAGHDCSSNPTTRPRPVAM